MKSNKRRSLGKGLAAAGRSQTFLYLGIVILLILFPIFDSDTSQVNVAAVAGVWILLALGLNIVVGYAGLLDLGYAAFFAIGSYAFAILASGQFNIHISFWILLPLSAFIAAIFGVLLGAPTLRLRGDYLAIVTLGFGEIVPRVFRNATPITGGVNGIVGIDQPKLPPVFGWNGNFGFNGAYGTIVRCSTVGIGSNFLVRPGRLIGIRARRAYRYHYRQHRRIDCSCYGDHSRYAEFNGMGCCFNLSLRSSGVWLLRNGAIASAIVALKFNICRPFVGKANRCERASAICAAFGRLFFWRLYDFR